VNASGERWRVPALLALSASALLPLLPLLSALLPALVPLERLADGWFELHCHRDPARTPQLLGVPLAVCARCSGIYVGLGLGAALRWPALTPPQVRRWVLAGALLMVGDVLLEARGLHGPWPSLRLLTGLALAYPVGTALGALVSRRHRAATADDRS
jgi:uncharacterized membrane protein